MKKLFALIILLMLGLLAACGESAETEERDSSDELQVLDVEFVVPETADAGEPVQLEAIVTYGETLVEDADEVVFEYWLKGNEDDSTKVEGIHLSLIHI